MWLDLAWQLRQGRERTLSRRAARCFDLLRATQNRSESRRAEKFEEFADATPEGNLIRVYDAAGTLAYADRSSPRDFPWTTLRVAPGDHYDTVMYASRHFLLLTRIADLGGGRIAIHVGGQLEDNRQLLARFQAGLEAATPVLLAVSALCGYFLSRRALKPVGRLISGVRSISAHDLSGRLPVYPTGDELQSLAETCNDMLSRLEGAVSRINQFTADASHELRNPIFFVQTVSESALQHQALDTETRQTFEDIHAEATEAGRLLEDMLVLARADEGRLNVTLEPLDLAELLDAVFEKVRVLAFSKSQEAVLRFRVERPVMIDGDRAHLRRLLWSLTDNAIKYTPEGGRLEIEVESENRGSQFVVRIQDSGIGIPQAMLPRIFERFFRADPSRAQAGGTGLGLAIAKWIADAHQASLSVQSEEGNGTTLEVRFQKSGTLAPEKLALARDHSGAARLS
jgi:signal transduction histidine kinase